MARQIDLPESNSPSGARRIEVKDNDISRFRSLVSAPVKGLLKELPTFANLTNPVTFLMPRDKYEAEIEKILPTQPEFAEKALERFGRTAPYLAAGGEGILPSLARGGLSALAGQATEEMGGGPLAQGVAELGAFASPSLARKIIPSNAQQKAILNLGRKHGMSEKQLAPLMPSDSKRKYFGKIASKGEAIQEKLRDTKEGIGNIMEGLKNSPEAEGFLSPKSLNNFASEMQKIGLDMPHNLRVQLKNDAQDLVRAAQKSGGVSGKELINFFRDVSSRYNLGKAQLQRFKDPIKRAVTSISPELGNDFEVSNKMWERNAKMRSSLKANEYEDLINMGEAGALGIGAITGNIGLITKILGIFGGRKFAADMLTNPRLQNLIYKTFKSIKGNKLPIAKKTADILLEEYKKESE